MTQHDASRSAAPESTAGGSPVASGRDLGILELLNAVLKRWRVVVGLPLGATVVAVALLLIWPLTFTARTAFLPEATAQGRIPSGLAGLAGQFGIALGTEPSQSPQFYAAIVTSPGILDCALLSRYRDPYAAASTDSSTLLTILRVRGNSREDTLHNGRKKLRGLVAASIDHPTRIVTLSVAWRDPALAADVANRMLDCLNDFNATRRQSQARELRRFTEARLLEAERQLQLSEEAVRGFYERNRTWQGSPQLTFEHERLQRQVRVAEEITLTLRREYESARIAEVNDTPVITQLYRAEPPREKSGPKRRLLVIFTFFLSLAAALLVVLGQEYTERLRETNDGQYLVLNRLIMQLKGDVRNLFRRRRP